MSYHIYTTEALVISSVNTREADRMYTLLTRDLGLIRAAAGGVRKEVSKLRGNLEPISLTTVSLVRGKGDWRITSASLIRNLNSDKELILILSRVFSLLTKLVVGEEKHPEVFEAVKATLDKERGEKMELDLVAEILYQLGYLNAEDLTLDKKSLTKAVNEGIRESALVK